MLRTYYEKIWKDMLVKTNTSLVYHKNKTEFKEAEKSLNPKFGSQNSALL